MAKDPSSAESHKALKSLGINYFTRLQNKNDEDFSDTFSDPVSVTFPTVASSSQMNCNKILAGSAASVVVVFFVVALGYFSLNS